MGIGEAHVDWLVADAAAVPVSLVELRCGDWVRGTGAGVASADVYGPLSPPVTLMLPKVDILAALATRHRTHIQGALTQALVVHRAVSARIAGLPAAFYETWAFRVHIYGQFRARIPVAPVPVVVALTHAPPEYGTVAILDLAFSGAGHVGSQRDVRQRIAVRPHAVVVAVAVPVCVVLLFASLDGACAVLLARRTAREGIAVAIPTLVVRHAPAAQCDRDGPLASMNATGTASHRLTPICLSSPKSRLHRRELLCVGKSTLLACLHIALILGRINHLRGRIRFALFRILRLRPNQMPDTLLNNH